MRGLWDTVIKNLDLVWTLYVSGLLFVFVSCAIQGLWPLGFFLVGIALILAAIAVKISGL